MAQRGHLKTLLALPRFRRLFAARMLGQFGDGVFQASLAGAVLFNPEKQAHAADIAAGFAVVLVPYSFIGPFAGVLLDRWRRQRVLVQANIVRALWIVLFALEVGSDVEGLPFYAGALVVVSVGRFVNSALSASLPHVVNADNLVTANAFSTTAGAIIATAGGAAAIGVRGLIGESAGDYALLALGAGVIYALASLPARGFDPDELGPDERERGRRETVGEVARGLAEGMRYLRTRRSAYAALLTIALHRLAYGISIVGTLLLYRNYFTSDGVFRAGLSGLAQVVAAVAVGGGLAAVVTPSCARRLGYVGWPAALLLFGAVVQAALGLPFRLAPMLLASLLLGFVAQGIKICVDTVVQRDVDDAYRGRVFALYDTLFNVTLVLAAVITAVALPQDGHSAGAVVGIAVTYAVAGLAYLKWAPQPLSSRRAARTTA
jgi:MFS family permease